MPSEVSYATVTVPVAARSSVTAKPSAPSASFASASATDSPGGPGTVARDSFDSIRPSGAQTAPASAQSAVAGSTTVTGPLPSGATWIVQCLFVPGGWRSARVTVPPVTSKPPNFSVRKLRPPTSSLNVSSKVNAADPSCASGSSENDAVSACGPSAAGPGTVARDSPDSIRPSGAQTAPTSAQSVVAGSTTVTGPSPSGSTWIVQCRFVPGGWRSARVTVPPVATMPPNFSVR